MAELIVAFDLDSLGEAERLLEKMPNLRWAKIGPTLFLRSGLDCIRLFKERGVEVFLDLKWHDIPHQVAGAAKAASEAGVSLATVHALGGRKMVESAVQAAGEMRIAAVSVLTSHSEESYAESVGREGGVVVEDEVRRLVTLATEAGAQAVVASPLEAKMVSEVVPNGTWIVVPGIRPKGSEVGDQTRVATPTDAVGAGATHLVVGRPITGSSRPQGVFDEIWEDLK